MKGFSGTRPQRPNSAGASGSGVVAPDLQRGVLELIGQQAETGNIGRPTPPRGHERQQGHFQDIARLGAVDENGSRQRIDLAEIEAPYVGDSGVVARADPRKPPPRRIRAILRARSRNIGGQTVIPAVVLLMNRVLVLHSPNIITLAAPVTAATGSG